jgi:hypothetical protein
LQRQKFANGLRSRDFWSSTIFEFSAQYTPTADLTRRIDIGLSITIFCANYSSNSHFTEERIAMAKSHLRLSIRG